MSESVFKKLYDNCQRLIGGSEQYVYTIFYIKNVYSRKMDDKGITFLV